MGTSAPSTSMRHVTPTLARDQQMHWYRNQELMARVGVSGQSQFSVSCEALKQVRI